MKLATVCLWEEERRHVWVFVAAVEWTPHTHASTDKLSLSRRHFISSSLFSRVLCYSQLGDSTGLPFQIHNRLDTTISHTLPPQMLLTTFSPLPLPLPFHLSWRYTAVVCLCVCVLVLTTVPPATALPKYWQPNLISLPSLSFSPLSSLTLSGLGCYPFLWASDTIPSSQVSLSVSPPFSLFVCRFTLLSLPLPPSLPLSSLLMDVCAAAKMLRHCAGFI